MKPLVKNLYIRLLGKDWRKAYEVERNALNTMFMYRTMSESTTQLNFNFAANQREYDKEESVYKFIVRYGTHDCSNGTRNG